MNRIYQRIQEQFLSIEHLVSKGKNKKNYFCLICLFDKFNLII